MQLFADPKLEHLQRYFQAGSVAAYEHVAMIKLHYSITDALEACLAKLENRKFQWKERPNLKFHPLHGSADDVPASISVENVGKGTPRARKGSDNGGGGPISSYDSLTSEGDFEDESNWTAL